MYVLHMTKVQPMKETTQMFLSLGRTAFFFKLQGLFFMLVPTKTEDIFISDDLSQWQFFD